MRYWIIESPTRGILVDFDELDQKPRFAWSIMRTDSKARVFFTREKAERFLISKGKIMPTNCYTLEINNGRVIQ